MAVVKSRRKIVLNRLAIVAVLLATVVFLGPIYWIGSTAFKPKEVATSVPPTVFFKPEITPFIRLFTKRVQMTKDVDPAEYAAAPWWEKAVYDGGERMLKVGTKVQLLAIPQPLREQPDRRRHQHDSRRWHGDVHRLWLFPLQDGR